MCQAGDGGDWNGLQCARAGWSGKPVRAAPVNLGSQYPNRDDSGSMARQGAGWHTTDLLAQWPTADNVMPSPEPGHGYA